MAELLSAILCRGVSVQIKRGLIRQYISREEALASPRGKLEIGESIKTQVIRKKQLICNYDEFSVDAYPKPNHQNNNGFAASWKYFKSQKKGDQEVDDFL